MVICSEQYINVTLRTVEPFKGRIYVVGHSDTCDSEGSGQYTTSLTIPMSGSGSSNRCGIMVFKSNGETNQYVSCYKNARIQDYEAIELIYSKRKFIVIYYTILYISTGH
jgi:hypothetical protein